MGPIELLVNNAAAFEDDSIDRLDLALWRRQFAVDLESPVFLIGAFAAALPAEREGAVVNIIDQRVLKLTPEYLSYTLAKSALWTATRTLAQALGAAHPRQRHRPRPDLSQRARGRRGPGARGRGHAARPRRFPATRSPRPCCILARARSVTGQIVCVDSGQHLGWRTPDIVG